MEGFFDFDEVLEHFHNNDIDAIKQMIVAENVNFHDDGDNILTFMCMFGPDDVALFRHFVALGAQPQQDEMGSLTLLAAATNGKPRILRELLDTDENASGFTRMPELLTCLLDSRCFIVDDNVIPFNECDRIMVDAGAQPDAKTPLWLREFATYREAARSASIVILGLLQRCGSLSGNGKDVLRIIARCVWSTRGHTDSWT